MLDLQPATFEEFEREAARGNVVPVVRTMFADLLTPVGAFLRLAGESPRAFFDGPAGPGSAQGVGALRYRL